MNPSAALVSAGGGDPNMFAKDMFPPVRDPPGSTSAATWRETTNGVGADAGLEAPSVRCAAVRCTGIGGPTATDGLDPTSREGYAADAGAADANGAGTGEVWKLTP